jgi:bile-acid 7alpha-dehydratase
LERRIRVLEDIEAIKKLKSKYWRCIDRKRWDELAECFAEDVVLDDASSNIKLKGRKAFVKHLKKLLGRDSITMAHQGHNPDIEITSGTTAKGIWALRNNMLDLQANTVFTGRGFYEDEYIKEKGEWKIKSTKLNYLFTEGWKRGYGQEIAWWPESKKEG